MKPLEKAPSSPLTPDIIDQLDDERQQLLYEKLHFNDFIKKISPLKPCRCPSGNPIPARSEGPANDPGAQRRIECGLCHQFIAWLPKIKNQHRRPSRSTGLASQSFCQCCLKSGVNLEGHHIIEVAEGGSDAPDNIWTLCEPCHAVIHALRRLAAASMTVKQRVT